MLDALRGFALLGVLLVNLRALSLYDFLPKAEKAELPSAAVDTVLNGLTSVFVDGTSITLFTILFGVGFAMQMQQARQAPGAMLRYTRRLAVLLVIGALHAYLLWWGDILRYYALLGLLLIPLARLPVGALAGLGALVVFVLPVVLQPLIPPLLPQQISNAESAAQSLAAFSSDHWSVMLDGNLSRDLRMRIAVWILPTYIFGRMLIGVALGNSGMLAEPAKHAQSWRRLWWISLLTAIVVTGVLSARKYGVIDGRWDWLSGEMQRILWRVMRNAAPLAMGLFYLASFVRLYAHARCRAILNGLAPIGRMALTSYISQSVLGVAIFYGVGLGIGPQFGAVGVLIAAALILLLQIVACRWWLARYRFGPLEWVWRSLTYGRRQAMRIE